MPRNPARGRIHYPESPRGILKVLTRVRGWNTFPLEEYTAYLLQRELTRQHLLRVSTFCSSRGIQPIFSRRITIIIYGSLGRCTRILIYRSLGVFPAEEYSSKPAKWRSCWNSSGESSRKIPAEQVPLQQYGRNEYVCNAIQTHTLWGVLQEYYGTVLSNKRKAHLCGVLQVHYDTVLGNNSTLNTLVYLHSLSIFCVLLSVTHRLQL